MTLDGSVYETSTEHIFNNGVFGFINPENIDYLTSNTVRKSKAPKLAMIRLAIHKAFPGYKALSASENYSFIKGKPFLLPYAWIYRFVDGSKRNGFSMGKRLIAKSFVSKEYMDKREEMFSNWGL